MQQDYNDEAYVNSLVDEYRITKSNSQKMEILKAFDPYFKKYSFLLCTQKPIDISNKDTLKFLRLFMSDEDRATETTIASASKRTIAYLRNLFKDCEPGDIYDEMVCSFLEQLNRYKPMIADHTPHKKRISFTHFVQVNVRYKMKMVATVRAKDAMQCPYNMEYNDELNGLAVADSGIPCGWTNIDLKWVYGDTTGDIFRHLDDYERYLLYLKYSDGEDKPLSDYDIARLTGQDRMYVRRKMLKIKDKLSLLREK
jgi:hypothetical protein